MALGYLLMATEDGKAVVGFGTEASGVQQRFIWDFSLIVGGLLQTPRSIATHQTPLGVCLNTTHPGTVGNERQMA